MKTYIVLIPVDYFDARKTCEEIENQVFENVNDLVETVYQTINKGGIKEVPEDINRTPMIMDITEFMDEVNNQELDNLSEYFMSYVQIK